MLAVMKKKGVIISLIVVLLVVILFGGAYLFYSSLSKNKEIDEFSKYIEKAKITFDKLLLNDDEVKYEDLIEQCEKVISSKNNDKIEIMKKKLVDLQDSVEEKNEKVNDEEKKVKDSFVKNRYSSTPYQIENMKRVLPQQARYVSFDKESRFTPVRKNRNICGIIVLNDTKPDEPVTLIKTIRQIKDVNAPMPKPFKVEDNLDFDHL